MSREPDDPAGTARADVVPFGAAVRAWFAISLQTFGGPAGQIAVMQRALVEDRRWIGQRRFLHALGYCMLLPGPEAHQLAVYVGWLLNGLRGGIAAGVLFVLPGLLAMLALSALYVGLGEQVQDLLADHAVADDDERFAGRCACAFGGADLEAHAPSGSPCSGLS